MTNDASRGHRVARARRRRGMTQHQLAAAMGRSVSWVSQVERGIIGVDRVSVLDRLARVLQVEGVELTGQPYRHEQPDLDSGHDAIPALRLAVQHARMPNIGTSRGDATRTIGDLRIDVEHAEQLRQEAAFSALGAVVPGLIEEATAARRQESADGGRDELGLLLVRLGHIARVTADLTGHHDLAWTACELEITTARELGSPAALAAATWDLCGVWLHSGAHADARDAALSGIATLDGYVGRDPELTALAAALHLRAAVAYSRLWAEPDVNYHLAQAAALAPASGNTWQTQANQPNVRLHALETAVEMGRPSDARGFANAVRVDQLPARERQTHYWTVCARSAGMNGRLNDALDAILRAERLAPAHVHNRPMARDLVADLLHRDRRGDQRLRALARRMAVV